MVIPPPWQRIEGYHEKVVELYEDIYTRSKKVGRGELSLGMSEDLEIAIAHGSSIVRVGRALLGPRPS